jgi:hypothetical protein
MFSRAAIVSALSLTCLFAAVACTEDVADDHGSVAIRVLPAAGNTAYFPQTTQVTIQVRYNTCLSEFYQTNPSYQIDGVEGSEVFGSWQERLCNSGEFSNIADCTVEGYQQFLDDALPQMRVTYGINDGASIPNAQFRVGPVPLEDLAGCAPTIEVPAAGVSGLDAAGTVIWRGTSVDSENTARPNQGADVEVTVDMN